MTREEAIRKLKQLKNKFLDEYVDYDGTASAYDMAIEALAKIEVIQRVIDMPMLWEQDDRLRYAKVAGIIYAKNISEEGFLCSNCSFGDFGLSHSYKPDYCPNCGAKIETESEG